MKTFGLICEGPSEYRIINYLTQRFLGDSVVNPIQPPITDGKQASFGGWMNVLKYCTESNFDAILSMNDYLIIQIDTDSCEEYGYGLKTVDENGVSKSDNQLYEDVKSRLMDLIPTDSRNKYDGKIIFAICFNETECWLLPIYYSDNRRCSKIGCVDKLNRKLSKEGMGIPAKDKNSTAARKVYDKVLRNLKKAQAIRECSRYNYGFERFIDQLEIIKNRYQQ